MLQTLSSAAANVKKENKSIIVSPNSIPSFHLWKHLLTQKVQSDCYAIPSVGFNEL